MTYNFATEDFDNIIESAKENCENEDKLLDYLEINFEDLLIVKDDYFEDGDFLNLNDYIIDHLWEKIL